MVSNLEQSRRLIWNKNGLYSERKQIVKVRKKLTKKSALETFISVVVVIGAIALATGIQILLKSIASNTNSLFAFFIYVFYRESFISTIFTILLIFFLMWLVVSDDRKGDLKWFKERMHKILPIGLGIITLILLIYNCFDVDRSFRVCTMKGETPSRNEYHLALLKDVISGDTEKIEIDINEVYADYKIYSYTTRSRHGSHTSRGITYYLGYTTAEGDKNTAVLLDYTAPNYINEMKKLEMDAPLTVTIEYYPNSGAVKYVDGCSPYDEEGLNAIYLEKKKEYDKKQEEYEAIAAEEARIAEAEKKERNRRFAVYFNILTNPNVKGRNFEEVKAEIEAQDVSFDDELATVYISTRYYEPGSIVFYDNVGRTVYVAKDKLIEEMIQVPEFDRTTPVSEIIEKLKAAGITYECDGYDASKNQRLNTYYCGPGTLIPKRFVYWFSVR